jgi:hypothetical protein
MAIGINGAQVVEASIRGAARCRSMHVANQALRARKSGVPMALRLSNVAHERVRREMRISSVSPLRRDRSPCVSKCFGKVLYCLRSKRPELDVKLP